MNASAGGDIARKASFPLPRTCARRPKSFRAAARDLAHAANIRDIVADPSEKIICSCDEIGEAVAKAVAAQARRLMPCWRQDVTCSLHLIRRAMVAGCCRVLIAAHPDRGRSLLSSARPGRYSLHRRLWPGLVVGYQGRGGLKRCAWCAPRAPTRSCAGNAPRETLEIFIAECPACGMISMVDMWVRTLECCARAKTPGCARVHWAATRRPRAAS